MVFSNDIVITRGAYLAFADLRVPCAIGKGGLTSDKCEGDMATPLGRWCLRRILYRADKIAKPETALPIQAIKKHDGWCDAPGDPAYNQLVTLPYSASAERLCCDDDIYDIIVVLGYNDAPVIPNKGSAIFFHIARPDFSGTQGCVAVTLDHMTSILKNCTPETYMLIEE